MNRSTLAALALLTLLAPAPARAERVQVFSIQKADCGSCGERLKKALKPVPGVRKAEFDVHKVELTVHLEDGVSDETVLEAVKGVGLEAVVGAGKGAYLPREEYPPGSDVEMLSPDGRAVGPLEKLRVPGKHTVFDIFAEWCGPCRTVEERLRAIVATRGDVAVRRLDVVDFDTPLARELGPRFEALPYLVVFSPSGKRTDIVGLDFAKLDKALSRR